jgi:predicted TPR repeat methyltransferase
MVERTRAKGIDAGAVDLCELDGKFDVITAVFDMMNYLPPEALSGFFRCIRAHLNDGGYFIFDINTLYGFENVAVGAYIVEDEERFLAIDSDFDTDCYQADFTLFEKRKEGSYIKQHQRIQQFFHSDKKLKKVSGMHMDACHPLPLYGLDAADKYLIVMQKRGD